ANSTLPGSRQRNAVAELRPHRRRGHRRDPGAAANYSRSEATARAAAVADRRNGRRHRAADSPHERHVRSLCGCDIFSQPERPMKRTQTALTWVFLAWAVTAHAQTPLGTAFTYQGRLEDSGSPASGLHDLRFRLFDATSGGAQVGATICADNVNVVGGLFT